VRRDQADDRLEVGREQSGVEGADRGAVVVGPFEELPLLLDPGVRVAQIVTENREAARRLRRVVPRLRLRTGGKLCEPQIPPFSVVVAGRRSEPDISEKLTAAVR
jgi:hypothetical protein